MTNPEVEDRWRRIEALVLDDLAGDLVTAVFIPNWDPVDLEEGLRWLRINVYEGFEVDALVERSKSGTVLWLKSWEYWDPEDRNDDEVPDWDEIKRSRLG